jgi:hypothetical protein
MSGLHHPDAILDKARRGEELQPSGRQGNTVLTLVFIMKIVGSKSVIVRTQHRPDAALFRKDFFSAFWKVGCKVVRMDGLSLRSDAA